MAGAIRFAPMRGRSRRSPQEVVGAVLFAVCAVAVLVIVVVDKLGAEPPQRRVEHERAYCAATPPREPYDAGAAPYAGRGPHLAIVLSDPVLGERRFAGGARLPDEWLPRHADELQLVVCETVTAQGAPDTCHYGDPVPFPGPPRGGEPEHPVSVTMYPARYRYEVFEAATGAPVDTFTIDGEGGCPNLVDADVEGDTLYEDVDPWTLRNRMRPLVE